MLGCFQEFFIRKIVCYGDEICVFPVDRKECPWLSLVSVADFFFFYQIDRFQKLELLGDVGHGGVELLGELDWALWLL